MTPTSRSTPARLVVKVLVTSALLAALIYKVGWLELYATLGRVDMRWLLLTFVALVAQLISASGRWLLLAERAGMPGGPRNAALIFLVSCIANLVLVTSLAGVSLKALLHYRLGASVDAITVSTIVEKLLGLFAMALTFLLLGLTAENQTFVASLFAAFVHRASAAGANTVIVYATAAVCGAALTWLAVVKLSKREAAGSSRVKQSKTFIFRWTRTTRAVARRLLTLPALVPLVVLSLVTFILGAVAILLTARGFSLTLPSTQFLFLYPAIAILSALPISVGGWGVREGAMVAVLGLLGIAPENALAISIAYGLAGMAASGALGLLGYGLLLPQWDTFFSTRRRSDRNMPNAGS